MFLGFCHFPVSLFHLLLEFPGIIKTTAFTGTLTSGVASVLGVGVRVGIGSESGMPPTGHQSRAVFFLVASDLPFLAWGTPLEGRLLKLPSVISFQLLL